MIVAIGGGGALAGGAELAQAALPAEIGDLTLADGRVLRSVVVLSQTATAINVRHAGGLTKIAKQQLPSAVLARFPVDEALAAQEKAQQDEARRRQEAARAAQRMNLAAAPRPAAPPGPRPALAAVPAQPAVQAQARATTPEEQREHAPHGLYILNWTTWSGSEVNLVVTNPTAGMQRIDPGQLMALVFEGGQTVDGTGIQFPAKEVASYWVDPGQTRTFRVVFPGGRELAAVTWRAAQDWRVSTLTEAEAKAVGSADEAMMQARENKAVAKELARIRAGKVAADQAKKLAGERMINK